MLENVLSEHESITQAKEHNTNLYFDLTEWDPQDLELDEVPLRRLSPEASSNYLV